MASVQAKKPVRSQVAARAHYSDYRAELRADFNGCCGYCDDADERVDKVLFHIDHFAPRKKFPLLESEYGNLVYACRFCNICKGDHWFGNHAEVPNDGQSGLVDPCAIAYDDHLERDDAGRIVAKSELGRYMVRRLKLNLLRHELLWNARKVRTLRAEVQALLARLQASGNQTENTKQLLDLALSFVNLTKAIEGYELGALNA